MRNLTYVKIKLGSCIYLVLDSVFTEALQSAVEKIKNDDEKITLTYKEHISLKSMMEDEETFIIR